MVLLLLRLCADDCSLITVYRKMESPKTLPLVTAAEFVSETAISIIAPIFRLTFRFSRTIQMATHVVFL